MKKSKLLLLFFAVLAFTLLRGISTQAATPDLIWPTDGSYHISCIYYYKNGSQHSTSYGYTHSIDIGTPAGRNCWAADAGKVITSVDKGKTSYGQYIVIQHSDGSKSLYAHLSARYVKAGDSVRQGQLIGKTGNSGNSTGAHLHFEYSGGDPWKDCFRYKYSPQITFDANCYSNNNSYNSDKTICNWIKDYYQLENGQYVWSGMPEGHVDEISAGSAGTVHVRGWAFDRDNILQALEIHVYIGGPAGSSGTEGHQFTAGVLRTDVGAAYPGAGNYHGFDETIKTSKTGKQEVYIYAINTGAKGENVLIGSGTVTIKSAQRASISLNSTSTNIYVGKSVTLKATVTGSSKKVTWSSSNKKVATVKNGKVTGIKAGTATITAKANGKKATCKVTVKNRKNTFNRRNVVNKKKSIKVFPKKKTINVGGTFIIETLVTGPSRKVKWSSSNKKVATVKNGKVTGKKAGTVTITAKANGKKATCKVTVKKKG